MSRVLALVAFCACLLRTVQGAAFTETVPEHPTRPGKCLYQGRALEVDQAVTNHSTCTQLMCRKTKTNNRRSPFRVEETGCDLIAVTGNCRVEIPNTRQDFPGCCPRLNCHS